MPQTVLQNQSAIAQPPAYTPITWVFSTATRELAVKLSFSISFRQSVFVEVGPFTLHMCKVPGKGTRWGAQREPGETQGELWVPCWYITWAWGEEKRNAPSLQWRPLPT